jgi:hypothetical protein
VSPIGVLEKKKKRSSKNRNSFFFQTKADAISIANKTKLDKSVLKDLSNHTFQ